MPYLIAVSPGVARDYLDPSSTVSRRLSDRELDHTRRLRRDGVEFALHGFDHRTRDARSRHRSELVGLSPGELTELLDLGSARLAAAGITRACSPLPSTASRRGNTTCWRGA